MDEDRDQELRSNLSSAASDFFADEAQVGCLLKSLIDPNGLQSAWKRVASRLQKVEGRLQVAQECLDRLPTDYVSLNNFKQLVESEHADKLKEQGEVVQKVDDLMSSLHKTVFMEHDPQLKACLERLGKLESSQADVRAKCESATSTTAKLGEDVRKSLEEGTVAAAQQAAKVEADAAQLRSQVETDVGAMRKRLEEIESRSREFTVGEIKRATGELLDFDRGTDVQEKILTLVQRGIIDKLQAEVEANAKNVSGLFGDLTKQHGELSRQLRTAEKAILDVKGRWQQSTHDINEELKTFSKKTEAKNAEAMIVANVDAVSSDLEAIKTKVVLKMNEFVDHLGKVHETLDDHEHCLRHHAEEIENRTTKYDLFVCRSQIDRCAQQDAFLREVNDLKKRTTWLSSKVEGTGLGGGASGRRRKLPHHGHKPRGVSRRFSVMSNHTADGDMESHAGSSVGGDEVHSAGGGQAGENQMSPNPSSSLIGNRSSVGTLTPGGSLSRLAPNFSTATIEGQATTAGGESEREGEDDAEGGSESSESEDYESSLSFLMLRQQLEAVAMGLVGLGHLALREPGIASRNIRLGREKDLLSELQSVRHWITNRTMPSGWDPQKLTTVALSCTHPREDEVAKGPVLQVGLRSLLPAVTGGIATAAPGASPKQEPRRLGSPKAEQRYPSAEARLRSGKTLPLLGIAAGPQAPQTARGNNAPDLPPLQGLAAAVAG